MAWHTRRAATNPPHGHRGIKRYAFQANAHRGKGQALGLATSTWGTRGPGDFRADTGRYVRLGEVGVRGAVIVLSLRPHPLYDIAG